MRVLAQLTAYFRATRQRLQEHINHAESLHTLLWAIPIGIVGALVTVAFRYAIDLIHIAAFGKTADVVELAQGSAWYIRLLLPAVGGVVAGFLLLLSRRYAQAALRSDYMEAITLGDGRIPVRQTLARSSSSLCSIATGSSIGQEGPMVQLAALCASLVGRIRRISPEQLRTLVACGAAAGITSVYNAPIAGAFFVAEIVLGSIVAERMPPLIMASVVANLTMRALPGYHSIYTVPPFEPLSLGQDVPFILLGILLGLLAPVFLWLLDSTRHRVEGLPIPLPVKLGTGGLVVGLISIAYPQTWGNGYSVINDFINSPWPWMTVAALLVFKVLATLASAGTGTVGGIFTPTLFVGAAIGVLFSHVIEQVAPAWHAPTFIYAVVGMGAFLAATSRAPLMAILMVFEMTLSYDIVLPLLLCVVAGYFISSAFSPRSMYAVTVKNNELWKARNQTRNLQVRSILCEGGQTVAASATLDEVLETFREQIVKFVYVIDEDGHLLKVVSLRDLNQALAQGMLNEQATAQNLPGSPIPSLHPYDNLTVALEAFLNHPGERLPVVESETHPRLLGYISKSQVLAHLKLYL
ncbi:CIC family chloride channel protein [Pseudomonas duriflava]|uniref:CIC family chloride channel protein n=1 Tax=Pseudomonas duriflava TaxID=459528 RepID=A0A562QE33_9PSED|nr:ClcB-like voltage-gated chloride channel protein [Pseudomonas duriflava]TWI55012.1 CIC family chloride channel protein [Pseudomonas duriflava]